MTPFTIYPEHYQQQLDNKVNHLRKQLSQLNTLKASPTIDVHPSPPSYYRMRAEFKVWHEGDSSYYAMHDQKTKKPVFLNEFPVAAKAINRLMPLLMEAIKQHDILRKKLFQVEFLTTLTEDTLVTLIYHKPLDEEWVNTVTPIKETLGIQVIGRSRKQKIVLDRDYVNESLNVNQQTFHYQQNEGSFTQPNATVCEAMLSWVVTATQHQNNTQDLLELYCGNGNFTLPLAQNFNRVLATEISTSSVNAAQKNIEKNAIHNVKIVRMSSEDFAQAMDKVRPFRRLQAIDLDSYHFSSVLVDPPRAGLDSHTLKIIQGFEQIIYISCNPTSLIDNLAELSYTHQISALAAFDQFPYTDHLEVGVILQRSTTSNNTPL